MAADPEGRKVIPMEERVRRPSAPLGEVGRTGTQSFHGFIQTDEYVPELVGVSGLRTLDKMRRSDGMVKAVLRALTMPLLAATWKFEPASEERKDRDIAAEVEEGLFDGMTTGWAEVLRQMLTFLPLGFSVFEKVWEVRDVDDEERVMLRKLAPRLQSTIFRMNTDKGGGLESIEQQVYDPSGGPSAITIKIERLLMFVNDKEGAQWMGTPILRPAYKHWWIKDNLYRIQAMAAERWGVGIPTVTLPPDQSDDENIRKAENILSSLRSHERAYVVWPAGYVFSLITSSSGGSQIMDLEPMIEHHDRRIAVSVLAQFLSLGATDVGSWALSNDQSALFLMVEQAIGDLVCDVINRHLVPEWVDYNYAGVKAYPKLRVSNIETRNFAAMLVGLAAVTGAGLITPDPDLEDALRDGLKFPKLPRDADGNVIKPEAALAPGMEVLPPGVVDTQAPPPGTLPPGGTAPSGAATNPGAPQPQQPATAPRPTRPNVRKVAAGTQVFGDRNDAAIAALMEGDPERARRIVMAGIDAPATPPVTGAPPAPGMPSLTPAQSYEAENAQIAANAATEAAAKPHKFIAARYTHTDGQLRCLMCGGAPVEGEEIHTQVPKPAVQPFTFHPRRPLLPIEEHVDFEAMDAALRESRARIRDAADTPVQRIIRGLAARAARALKDGDPSQLGADAIRFDTSELEAALKGELDTLYTQGAVEVRKEIASQIGKLRGDQRASYAREAAVVEAYRQAFGEMRENLAAGAQGTMEIFAKTVEALASRPIVVSTDGGGGKWKTLIDPATGAITGLEREKE